jgi:hypothetical protein
LLEAVHRHVVPALERQGPITAWMIPGSPRRGATRSGWRVSTAASSASGTTARSR